MTIATDFRALLARMADELDHYLQLLTDNRLEVHALSAEARAALSAPEQGPTDEDLYDLANDCDLDRFEGERSCPDGVVVKEGCWEAWDHQLVAFARAVLALWGRPAVEPVPVAERLPGPGDRDAKGRCWWLAQPARYAPTWVLQRPRGSLLGPFIAWAPHWALPLSQEGADG